jgi:hypothetical protein
MVFSIDVQRYELFPTSHPFHMKIFVLKMANAQTLNFVHTKVHRRDFHSLLFSCAKIVINFLSSKFFRKKNTKFSNFILSISAKFSNSFLCQCSEYLYRSPSANNTKGPLCAGVSTSPLGTPYKQTIQRQKKRMCLF